MKLSSLLFERILERRVSAYQNALLTRHYEEVQSIYQQMRGWRHDYHNHIQAMLALSSNAEALRAYLIKLNEDLHTVDTVLKTGNLMIDAILNSKLTLIRSKEIEVNAHAVVPETLTISDVDLCALIGNLMDNAMEACLRQPTGQTRFIRIYIGILKQQFYISVSNSMVCSGKPNQSYYSIKSSAEHGFGLLRIDRIVQKYQGFINRQTEEGVFATEILLPLV